ncbi:MAG: dibenzothiophene desulfurization enzyme [Pseudonocardiales bacterium]|nr:dibenzothiophene desulfurization enzyme [Pseudonocardiales bacterium]
MFHMGWFLSFNASGWQSPGAGSMTKEWMKADPWVDMGRSMERAGFDYMMLEDASFIPDVHRGSMEGALASGGSPKHDPMTLIPLIGRATKNLGIIATMTSTFYPPFLAARLLSTLDSLTDGRAGANLVTGHNLRTAQNFGLDEQIEHDVRYEMADEWVRVVRALWDTWEPGAVVLDEERGIFADHTKVHLADFKGQWYSSRGPLNTVPSPQHHPVFCQAGGSPAGRAFAAKHADTVVASVSSVEAMREYRADMDQRLIDNGRKPSDCKVLYVASPVLADSNEEADAKRERQLGTVEQRMERTLSALSFSTGIDFSKLDLDQPIPPVSTNAARSTTERLLGNGKSEAKTLREHVSKDMPQIALVGTPDKVASIMGDMMEEAGGDGFLISGQVTRRFVGEVCEGLAPALRKRGLVRDGYSHTMLRENLQAF